MLKRFVSEMAQRAGYRIIPAWRLPNFEYSEFLGRLMDLYQVGLVLDVGANVGQFYDYLRMHVGYEGWVVSFEPNPACVARLRARLANESLWAVEPVALGGREGTLTLNIMRSSSFSSFLAPDPGAVPELKHLNTIEDRCNVPVRRLDAIDLTRYAAPATPIFLKLDTQGYDLEALKGAVGLLERCVAIQTEASVLPIYAEMPDIMDTIMALAGYGFSMVHAFPVTRDSALRAVEFDLLFLNDSCAKDHRITSGEKGVQSIDGVM